MRRTKGGLAFTGVCSLSTFVGIFERLEQFCSYFLILQMSFIANCMLQIDAN